MGRPKLLLKPGSKLDDVLINFEITNARTGQRLEIEDRDLKNFLAKKFGVAPIEKKGAFTGELDVSNSLTIYDDNTSGSAISLSLSDEKLVGGSATVRIDGASTLTIPVEWNVSGDAISTVGGELNELHILYISDNDIRLVNRVLPA